jgi:hypothetical protein
VNSDDGHRRERGIRREKTAAARSGLIVVLSILFLALHLPYLPKSLEDLDSINFALGVQRFDIQRHRPHPPGYPLFILAARAIHAVGPSETIALSLVSVIAGALGVLAIGALFRRLEPGEGSVWWPEVATALAIAAPLYWFTAERPLSDMAGLAAAIAVQVLILRASGERALIIAGFLAGLAAGLRSQVVWLTVPLLVVAALGAGGSGLAVRSLSAVLAGGLVWFVPLVVVTGGPAAYWHALFDQGADDLSHVEMLLTRHDRGAWVDAMYHAFVAPWGTWPLAAGVIVLALAGLAWMWRRAPRALGWLALGFGPYLLFDFLFQETFTSRYALPLVIPVAYLAVAGTRIVPANWGLALAIPMAMFGAHVGGTSLAAYGSEKAPAFRLFDDLRTALAADAAPPVIAMDRRELLDLRKPLVWAGDPLKKSARVLAAPPQHEWLEAVKYWNGGGRAPVWFVVDPMRTDIDLVQHGQPASYRWPLPYPALIDGVRPDDIDWYRVDRPEWYVGEGWSLTPESAGVANADRRGLAYGPITAWLNASASGGTLMIGGRNLEPALRPHLAVRIAGIVQDGADVAPGAFVRFIRLPIVDRDHPAQYVPVEVTATPPAHVAIEQFDASATRPIAAFGSGWYEPELNPATGVRWRWLSEHGELRVAPGTPPEPLTLHLAGESPRTYFSRDSHLIVRAGGRTVLDQALSSDFSLDIAIPAGTEVISFETDQAFSPADRSRRSQDRRRLGLRMFACQVTVQK